MSDHRYITYRCCKYESAQIGRRNLRKVNWSNFAHYLKEVALTTHLPEVELDGSNLDECAESLQDRIVQTLDVVCPERTPRPRKPCPWWTEELEEMRQRLRKAGNMRKSNQDRWDTYVELRREYSTAVENAKKDSWRAFCEKAESAKDISALMKLLEPSVSNGVSLLKEGDRYTSSPQEALEVLMRTHFPDSTPDVGDDRRNKLPPDETGVVQFINTQKVRVAISSFGNFKSPGPDGLSPVVLKHLGEVEMEYLMSIFKVSLAVSYVPVKWREMKVVFIPKVGKSDYASPKAYRPITLSNFCLKVMERLVQWYINSTILKQPLQGQHAYTKGRSTESALSSLVDEIESTVYRGRMTLAVSLDCSGAFDCIRFSSAKNAMRMHQIPHTIVEWYDQLLKGRKVKADLQGEQQTIVPGRGSPQGGVLSPLIWNLIMNSLLTQFGGGVKAIGYADDVLLYIKGQVLPVMGELMNGALKKVGEWGDQHGLTFNPNKTNVVLFTKKQQRKLAKPCLELNGKKLEYSDEMKYLGITIHRSLLWTDHVRERIKKCGYVLSRLRRVVGRDWGLTPDKLWWIYTAIVRPKLSYGSLVWAHDLGIGVIKSLNKLQRMILKGTSQALRSTPTAGMEVVAAGTVPAEGGNKSQAQKRLATNKVGRDFSLKRWHKKRAPEILGRNPRTSKP